MATEQIPTSIIADDAVTTAKINADAVTNAKIGAAAVSTTEIANDASISTSGNIATTGSGTLTSAGAFTASGGIANAGTITAGTLGSSVVFPAGHVIQTNFVEGNATDVILNNATDIGDIEVQFNRKVGNSYFLITITAMVYRPNTSAAAL